MKNYKTWPFARPQTNYKTWPPARPQTNYKTWPPARPDHLQAEQPQQITRHWTIWLPIIYFKWQTSLFYHLTNIHCNFVGIHVPYVCLFWHFTAQSTLLKSCPASQLQLSILLSVTTTALLEKELMAIEIIHDQISTKDMAWPRIEPAIAWIPGGQHIWLT